MLLLFFSLKSSQNIHKNTNTEHILSVVSSLVPIQRIIENYLISWEQIGSDDVSGFTARFETDHFSEICENALSPNNKFNALIMNGKLLLVNTITQQTSYPTSNVQDGAKTVSFSECGHYLAVGHKGGSVNIYDILLNPIQTIKLQVTSPFHNVYFSEDGRLCIETADSRIYNYSSLYLEERKRSARMTSKSKTCTIL